MQVHCMRTCSSYSQIDRSLLNYSHQGCHIRSLRLSLGILHWTSGGRAEDCILCVLDYPRDIHRFFTLRLFPISSCEISGEAK